jgi:hypothetical protein
MAFSGIVCEIPLGQSGISGIENPVVMLPSDLVDNAYVSYEGMVLRKWGGQAPYTTTPLGSTVMNGWDWFPTAGVQREVVFLGNGAVRKDSGTGTFPATLASGLAVSQPSQFVEGGAEATAKPRKLFLFTGGSPVQVLAGDGATMTALATPAADWTGSQQPLCGAVHANRLWAAGNVSDPHRVYYSTVDDHENFSDTTNAGSLSVFSGEGDRITGLFSYRGILIVGKAPRGIYVIDTTGIQPTTFRVDRLSRGIGLATGNAMTQVDNDVLLLDTAGNLQALSAVQALGDLTTLTFGQEAALANYLTGKLNTAQVLWARMVYYGLKREVHCAVPLTGETTNTGRLVVDYNGPSRPRFRLARPESCVALWLKHLGVNGPLRPLRGDTNGVVWDLDLDTPSPAGVPGSSARVLTPALDMGHVDPGLAARVKQGFYLELVTALLGPWNLDIDVYWDGRKHQQLAFSMRNAHGLPTDHPVSLQQRLLGSGRRIQFDVKQTVGGQDFAVFRLYFAFSALDHRGNEVYWR